MKCGGIVIVVEIGHGSTSSQNAGTAGSANVNIRTDNSCTEVVIL
mgnify:FL=1